MSAFQYAKKAESKEAIAEEKPALAKAEAELFQNAIRESVEIAEIVETCLSTQKPLPSFQASSAVSFSDNEMTLDLKGQKMKEHLEDDLLKQLFKACQVGDNSGVESVIRKGVNVNRYGGPGVALHIAACNGHARIVEILLRAGAEVNSKLGKARGWAYADLLEGATPLILGAANAYTELVQILLDHGADSQARTANGDTSTTIRTTFLKTVKGVAPRISMEIS